MGIDKSSTYFYKSSDRVSRLFFLSEKLASSDNTLYTETPVARSGVDDADDEHLKRGQTDDDLRKQIANLRREKKTVDAKNFEYISTIEQLERQLLSYARYSDRQCENKSPTTITQHDVNVVDVSGKIADDHNKSHATIAQNDDSDVVFSGNTKDDQNKSHATQDSIVSDDVFNQKFLLQSEAPAEDKSFGDCGVVGGDQQVIISDSHDLSLGRRRSLSSSSYNSDQSNTDSFKVGDVVYVYSYISLYVIRHAL